MKIQDLRVRKVLNSRAHWTIEMDMQIDHSWTRSSVPGGKSRGAHEAIQLPVDTSLEKFPKFRKELVKRDFNRQEDFDNFLVDLAGEKKEKFGVDLVLAASIAFYRANITPAKAMPRPMLNVLNGGMHAGNELAVQEFLIVPSHDDLLKNLEDGVDFYNALKGVISEEFGPLATSVGDEGGFAPPAKTTREALEILEKARDESGVTCRFALDCAASSYFLEGVYKLDGMKMDRGDYIDYLSEISSDFKLFSVEDPLEEEDFEGFAQFLENTNSLVIGDDLTVTDIQRVKEAAQKKSINCVLVKPNQVGTVTETLKVVDFCRQRGWDWIISHRSGETEDFFIADLAAFTDSPLIKAGAPCRGERTAKYNQLLRLRDRK